MKGWNGWRSADSGDRRAGISDERRMEGLVLN